MCPSGESRLDYNIDTSQLTWDTGLLGSADIFEVKINCGTNNTSLQRVKRPSLDITPTYPGKLQMDYYRI